MAFAGPKLRFGFRRLTQLSYTGTIEVGILETNYWIAKGDFGRPEPTQNRQLCKPSRKLVGSRTACFFAQEYALFAVSLHNGARPSAGRQTDIDVVNSRFAHSRRDIRWQIK